MPYNRAVIPDEQGRKPRTVAWALVATGALLFLAGFAWAWLQWVPVLYDGVPGIMPAERLKAITDTRTAMLAGLVGIGALATFALNARAQRYTAETLVVDQLEHQLNLQGQLNERYSKGVELLGDDHL